MPVFSKIFQRAAAALFATLLLSIGASGGTYLHVQGNKLLNESGQEVRLTGVNWFGFETDNLSPHGLWVRDYRAMLDQVVEMGFNCLRIPFCDKILDSASMPNSITFTGTEPTLGITNGEINGDLQGKNSLQVLDAIVAACQQRGLKVILDNHSRDPGDYANEMLWYTSDVSDAQWIQDWVTLATRYKGNSTVVGFDLDNEPHGSQSSIGSQWGTGDTLRDWRLAAERCGNAILAVNPDALIIVEGVEEPSTGAGSYWWGGNLTAAAQAPVRLSQPDKLLYSAHEYGPEVSDQPWFDTADFPANLPDVWKQYFGYLYDAGTSPLFIGEFGILDTASFQGKEGQWFDAFLKYIIGKFSWTFWCLNPDSGDTGGLLDYDWRTPVAWKVDRLKPLEAPLIDAPTAALRPDSRTSLRWSLSADGRVVFPSAWKTAHRYQVVSALGKTVLGGILPPASAPSLFLGALPEGIYGIRIFGSGSENALTGWVLRR